MAIFKTANRKGKYHDDASRTDVLRYILQEYKIPHNLFRGYNFYVPMENPEAAVAYYAAVMDATAARFKKEKGVKLRHFIFSFMPHEVSDPILAEQIAQRLACFYQKEYETVYAVHEDTRNLNIHIVINAVSYVDGHRYGGTRMEHHSFLNHAKFVLREYGINVWYQSNKDVS